MTRRNPPPPPNPPEECRCPDCMGDGAPAFRRILEPTVKIRSERRAEIWI